MDGIGLSWYANDDTKWQIRYFIIGTDPWKWSTVLYVYDYKHVTTTYIFVYAHLCQKKRISDGHLNQNIRYD
jgi:hypothetical protein